MNCFKITQLNSKPTLDWFKKQREDKMVLTPLLITVFQYSFLKIPWAHHTHTYTHINTILIFKDPSTLLSH